MGTEFLEKLVVALKKWGDEPTSYNAGIIQCAADELAAIKAENARLRDAAQDTLDLLRTGLAPDAFNMASDEWANYRINKAARQLAAALKSTSDEAEARATQEWLEEYPKEGLPVSGPNDHETRKFLDT